MSVPRPIGMPASMKLRARSDAGGQIKVGFRAVGHPDSVFFHPLYLFRAGVDAVSHDGLALRAESAEVIVGIPVKAGPGTQLPDKINLDGIFRQMGLQRQMGF